MLLLCSFLLFPNMLLYCKMFLLIVCILKFHLDDVWEFGSWFSYCLIREAHFPVWSLINMFCNIKNMYFVHEIDLSIKWENKCREIVLLRIDIVNYSYNVSAWSIIFCLSFNYIYTYYSSYVSISDKRRSLYLLTSDVSFD
jgi:hypothetical protein